MHIVVRMVVPLRMAKIKWGFLFLKALPAFAGANSKGSEFPRPGLSAHVCFLRPRFAITVICEGVSGPPSPSASRSGKNAQNPYQIYWIGRPRQ